MFAHICSQSIGCLFILFLVPFAMQKLISFEEGGAAVHVTDLLQLAEQMVVAFGPQQGTECMDTFKLRPEITLNLDHHLNTLSDLFLFHFAHDTSLAL